MPEIATDILALPSEAKGGFEFLETFRPGTYFTNVRISCGPYAIMENQEVEVLWELALLILNSLPQPPLRGTLSIQGQRYEHAAAPIFWANLNQGFYPSKPLTTSDIIVDNTLVRAVRSEYAKEWPDMPNCYDWDQRYPASTGLFSARPDMQFLNVAEMFGHFVLCLHTEAGNQYDEMVLWGLAQAITLLRSGDTHLANSLAEAIVPLQEHGQMMTLNIMDVVSGLFHDLKFPALRTWKNCRNIAEVAGTTKLFFE